MGEEAAAYMEQAVRVRPLAFSDSFGFRQVFTRSRDVSEPAHLAGLKIRTIQSAIYVKAVELMGGSATPMAFGEVYTSLETGVIDGYEHDASTTLQQRFDEVARFMARTRHIAGILGLYASSAGLARVPPSLIPKLEEAAQEAARRHRAMGAAEEQRGDGRASRPEDDDPRHRSGPFPPEGRAALAGAGPRRWTRIAG